MGDHWWFAVACLCVYISAEPTCKLYGPSKTVVICKPGDSDYILKRGFVSDNNKTTKIVLRACKITDVDYESFENLPSLKHLDLSQNTIRTLKLGVLDEALKVTHLNLSYNLLTEFPLGLFDQKPNLVTLDLTGNALHSFELGIFDPLTRLKTLYLTSNSISGKDLNPYIFDQSTKIAHLNFSRNDMSKTPDNLLHALESLEELNLDRTFLTEVPKFATASNLRSLKHLILSNNQIERIDDPVTFVNLDNLKILDLAQNNIEFIHESALKPLIHLVAIYLRKNKLTVISENLFQNVPKLVNIELSHNQLTSLSVSNFKGTSLKNLNISNNKIKFLPANFCSKLKETGINLSKLLFIPNTWECACLNELLNEVKIMNIQYSSHEFDGEHSVCFATSGLTCNRS
ncbi:carboxypeptidase N subunit 2-like isoform X2 [Battus philenor]|uniref:carboxypeptidase N subunit 2-like isoform X2 n=1 Tax=Battus philenor TaxID=42288 RepID=UPI0035CEF16C